MRNTNVYITVIFASVDAEIAILDLKAKQMSSAPTGGSTEGKRLQKANLPKGNGGSASELNLVLPSSGQPRSNQAFSGQNRWAYQVHIHPENVIIKRW